MNATRLDPADQEKTRLLTIVGSARIFSVIVGSFHLFFIASRSSNFLNSDEMHNTGNDELLRAETVVSYNIERSESIETYGTK